MKYGNYTVDESGNTSVSKIINKIKEKSSVIEFGSSYGYILDYLKTKKLCKVKGYEIDPNAVRLANEHDIPTELVDLDKVSIDLFNNLNKNIDFIICADVLEHLKNMDNILNWISLYMQKNMDCTLLVSFPNITYYGVIYELLHGKFKYNNLGILDNTHLRFYDKFELEKKFNEHALEVVSMDSIQVIPSDSEFKVDLNNEITTLLESYKHQDYLTYQYVFELKYSKRPIKIINETKNYYSPYQSLVIQKDTQIVELVESVNQKDIQIVELVESVNQKDTQIVELVESVNQKDTQIVELVESVNQKDIQIVELVESVNQKDTQIVELNILAHRYQNDISELLKEIERLRNNG